MRKGPYTLSGLRPCHCLCSFQRECKHNETQPCKNKNKDSKQNLSLFLSSLEIFKKAMKQTHMLLAALHCL
jgi:hypothetical protein